jgi:hypothetical protein
MKILQMPSRSASLEATNKEARDQGALSQLFVGPVSACLKEVRQRDWSNSLRNDPYFGIRISMPPNSPMFRDPPIKESLSRAANGNA